MTIYEASQSWKKLGIEHRAILGNPKGWDTFRQTIATRYFTDPNYTEGDIKKAYDYLSSQGVVINETDYLEGNPVHISIGSKIITQDLLVSASELHTIEKVVDMKSVRSCVEIGGGTEEWHSSCYKDTLISNTQ
ncbi:MAG: hypothetical protein Q8N88_02820 [Nanoarchaeota archaeon]|nr:hypothetical protein [Nanoarchaeota archaeon]